MILWHWIWSLSLDWCIFQPPPQKLLFAVDGDCFRDAQLLSVQRIRDHGPLRPKRGICIIFSFLRLGYHHGRGARKIVGVRSNWSVQQNRTVTMWTHCTQDLLKIKPVRMAVGMGRACEVLPLAEKLLDIDDSWGKESQFSSGLRGYPCVSWWSCTPVHIQAALIGFNMVL